MGDRADIKKPEKFFGKKRNVIFTAGVLAIIPAIIFIILCLYVSDFFKPDPKIEVLPENRFEKTLRVVSDIDYAPFSYMDEDENYLGFDVELMNEIANRLEMNLDLQLTDWSTANKIFLNGDADVIMNMESDLIVNNPNMVATLPTTEKQYVVYGKKNVTSVADLYGRRVASFHPVPGLGLDDEITYIDSYEVIFEALKRGEYEFAICPIQVGNNFLEKLDIKDVHPGYAVTHVYGSLCIHPQDNVLRVKLNAVLKQMQEEGRMEELDRKWINHRYENITLFEMVASRPWIGTLVTISLVVVCMLVAYIFHQYKEAKDRSIYTERLQENFDTIHKQQEELQIRNEELTAEKLRAELAGKAKTTFLFNMSHDIRTPMNAIIGYIELAKKEKNIPATINDFLGKIETSGKNLLALINDVLEMSRIENGKLELEEDDADICKLFDEVRDVFAMQMESKKINFTVDTSQVENRFVVCDINQLDRVLLNLLSNAYKFTPEGGSISVKLSQTGTENNFGAYEIRVKDTGIGMTKEFAEKVFDAFERERTSTVSGIQGTGLGMAITKSIVDMMRGEINLVTEKDKGTEFIIRLKFKLAKEPEKISEEKNISGAAHDFGNKKLLLVDDIEVNREIAKMFLTGAGFDVDTAADGAEAVKKVSESNPGDYDAILMDIQMPVMNGYDATRAIRKLENPELAKIPVIAMTANAFSDDVKAAEDAGMNGHIAKPIDIAKMMETLSKVFG